MSLDFKLKYLFIIIINKWSKMKSLIDLSLIIVVDNLIGDIDQRIDIISNAIYIPYNTQIYIINQLQKDKECISEFYETKIKEDINESDIFIQYVHSNNKEEVKTVLKYYSEYANAICSLSSHIFCPITDTALIVASNNGHTDIVEMLLKAGANVDARNKYGYTALIEASWGSHVDIIRMLLKAGADVNAQNHFGRTALIEASINGNTTDIVEMLLDAGADVSVRDITGQTALTNAIRKDHIGKIKLLRDAGTIE